jgi:hypothetical protein
LAGLHVSGTEGQADSNLWHDLRRLRITGLTFKDYCNNPSKMARELWKERADLSHIKSIRWGQENEAVAREEYEEMTRSRVRCCGLFVSKEKLLFAASPNGLFDSGLELLEIKCPFSLRNDNLHHLNMSRVPSSVFFTFENGNLRVKRAHSYFFQVQLTMYCTGCLYTDFVT